MKSLHHESFDLYKFKLMKNAISILVKNSRAKIYTKTTFTDVDENGNEFINEDFCIKPINSLPEFKGYFIFRLRQSALDPKSRQYIIKFFNNEFDNDTKIEAFTSMFDVKFDNNPDLEDEIDDLYSRILFNHNSLDDEAMRLKQIMETIINASI